MQIFSLMQSQLLIFAIAACVFSVMAKKKTKKQKTKPLPRQMSKEAFHLFFFSVKVMASGLIFKTIYELHLHSGT